MAMERALAASAALRLVLGARPGLRSRKAPGVDFCTDVSTRLSVEPALLYLGVCMNTPIRSSLVAQDNS